MQERVLNNFKSRLFPIRNLDKILTREPTSQVAIEPTPEVAIETTSEVAIETTKATKAKTERKISLLKLHKDILNEI